MLSAFYFLVPLSIDLGSRFLSLFRGKEKLFVSGRKNWRSSLSSALEGNKNPVIWVHCASLGEFEQGKPLIEAIRDLPKAHFILLTLFSPSGYEKLKHYEKADFVTYLPLDYRNSMLDMMNIVSPQAIVFVKYEFWPNLIKAAIQKQVDLYCISAVFRADQWFFGAFGKPFLKILQSFKHFFVQDEESKQLLEAQGFHAITVCGDTRIDQVLRLKAEAFEHKDLAAFTEGATCLFIGSAWPADTDLLIPALNRLRSEGLAFKVVIAPHEISGTYITSLCAAFAGSSTLLSGATAPDAELLIIDSVGILSRSYRYASFVYVGGAFGSGLHNTLEPAAYHLPLLFGDRRYDKFVEARALLASGAANTISSEDDAFEKLKRLLEDPQLLKKEGNISGDFIENQQGATRKIMSILAAEWQ